MIDYIIFDFDDVIISLENARKDVINKILKSYSINIKAAELNKIEGITTRNFLVNLRPKIETSTIGKILYDYNNDYKKNITNYISPIVSVANFIKNYNGNIRFGIASMSTLKVITQILHFLGLQTEFNFILSQEDVVNTKPNPEIYLMAIEKASSKPDKIIVLEDTLVGAQAAISAEIPCFIVLNSFNNKADFKYLNVSGFVKTEEDLLNLTI